MRSLAHVVCLTCLCSPRCTYWLHLPKMLSHISVPFNLSDSWGHLKQQLITSNFQTYSINELICANICCSVGLSKERSVPNRSPDVDVVTANVYPLIVMLTTANGLLKDIFYCNFITCTTSAYWECQSTCFLQVSLKSQVACRKFLNLMFWQCFKWIFHSNTKIHSLSNHHYSNKGKDFYNWCFKKKTPKPLSWIKTTF